ncbi:MAG TPA: ABC transporter ATP-binding protein [Vicinamibacterales bacterium]
MVTASTPLAASTSSGVTAGLDVRAEALRKVFRTSNTPGGPGGGQPFAGPRRGTRGGATTEVLALDGLTLEIRAGEIFGLLGPNGAGKSTTVGVLTTRVRPDGGRGFIGPHDVWRETVAVKRLIGVVQQTPNLDYSLTAGEILGFHAAYFGISRADRDAKARALLDRFKLTDRAGQLVMGFSGGLKQRLSIARAMMHDPRVLFLDEPSAGLDPQTRLLLWEIIREYNAAGRTILLTTHNMEEADAMCDRVAIVDHGRVIALGTPAELKQSVPGGYVVRVQFDAPPAALAAGLKELEGVTDVRAAGENALDLYADRGGPLVPQIVSRASAAGLGMSDVHISAPSLENLFLHHTGRSLRE